MYGFRVQKGRRQGERVQGIGFEREGEQVRAACSVQGLRAIIPPQPGPARGQWNAVRG